MTIVNQGAALTVNGSIISHVAVGPGGLLGGNGSVGATAVANGGLLALGNSICTLTVNGNPSLNPGAVYVVEANAQGKSDKVIVTGRDFYPGETRDVEDRAIPGHWEGDLIAGSKNSYIVTLVERHTRYAMLARIENKDTASVVAALARQVQHLPRELRRSLTWDRGKELADHKRLTSTVDSGKTRVSALFSRA